MAHARSGGWRVGKRKKKRSIVGCLKKRENVFNSTLRAAEANKNDTDADADTDTSARDTDGGSLLGSMAVAARRNGAR